MKVHRPCPSVRRRRTRATRTSSWSVGANPRTSALRSICCGAWPRAANSASTFERLTAPSLGSPPPSIRVPLSRGTCRRAASLAIDRRRARQSHCRPWAHIVEIHVGVVLGDEPNGQVAMLLRDDPQRVTALHRVVFGSGDAMSRKILLLQVLMVCTACSRKLLGAHPGEIQLHLVTE